MSGPDTLRLSKRDLLRLSKRTQLGIPIVLDFGADQLRLSKRSEGMMRLSRGYSAPKIMRGLDTGLSLSRLSKKSNAGKQRNAVL